MPIICHFKCTLKCRLKLDQSKILSSGNELRTSKVDRKCDLSQCASVKLRYYHILNCDCGTQNH